LSPITRDATDFRSDPVRPALEPEPQYSRKSVVCWLWLHGRSTEATSINPLMTLWCALQQAPGRIQQNPQHLIYKTILLFRGDERTWRWQDRDGDRTVGKIQQLGKIVATINVYYTSDRLK